MGRTLQNTMVNLGLQSACDEAIYQVGPPDTGVSHPQRAPCHTTSGQGRAEGTCSTASPHWLGLV